MSATPEETKKEETKKIAVFILSGCVFVLIVASLATWLYLSLYSQAIERREQEQLEKKQQEQGLQAPEQPIKIPIIEP